MSKKIYSAGLVSKRFWFYEFKQYMELLNEGKTYKEIRQLSDEVNVFGAVSESRATETYNAVRRRANVLGSEMQELFPKLNIDNQKIVALIAVFLLNDLMLEFMLEVYQRQVQKGILQITGTDYKAFFSEKQRTNDVVSNWKPYTYTRLSNSYKNYLLESGLIREDKENDVITPKILDPRVLDWLNSTNRQDIVRAITGGV